MSRKLIFSATNSYLLFYYYDCTYYNFFLQLKSVRQFIVRIIKFSELETVPWKNSGGITREIAALRSGDKIVWRLSMADVASDGPFSSFAGLTRILTVIEGNGIRLISADKTIQATYGTPALFDGGDAIQSELIDGAIRDLNVMFDAELCQAKVVLTKKSLRFETGQTIAIIGLEGTARINNEFDLQFGDTVLSDHKPVHVVLSGNASAIVVTLKLRD
jgi:uncharacterized protein